MDYKELSDKLHELESRYNKQFTDVYEAINCLLNKEKQETVQKRPKEDWVQINVTTKCRLIEDEYNKVVLKLSSARDHSF